MASGIVSVDLHHNGWEALSWLVLALAAAAWLWGCLGAGLRREPAAVAATAVVGTGLAGVGFEPAAWALLAAAVALWVAQLPGLEGDRAWRSGSGSVFLATVATESIAVLAATLAHVAGDRWLGAFGFLFLLVGLGLYARALVFFRPRELLHGRGDQWIAGGALAISTLACARLDPELAQLRVVSYVLWAAAMLWLPALAAGELLNPRLVGAPDRWSTVFPLGMYAAMSFAVGSLAGADWLRAFARGWGFGAAAVWALVLVDAVGRSRPRRASRCIGADAEGSSADTGGQHCLMRRRTERRLGVSGGRLIAIGTPAVVIGLILAFVLNGTAIGIGVAIAVLGVIPVTAGVVLLVTAGVERRSRKQRPFA